MTPGASHPPSAHPHHVHGFWRRRIASAAHWAHIYLSMISFGLLLFFAVTGFTLNHADWFYAGKQSTHQRKGRLEVKWVQVPDANLPKLEIVEHLRQAGGLRGAVGDFRIEEAQISDSFKGPGYAADVFVNRQTGDYELTESRMGFVAIINDLHKGRDAGRGWSAIIDLSAVLMTLVSLTGMVLLYFVKRRRVAGFWAAFAGAVLAYLAYLLWVP